MTDRRRLIGFAYVLVGSAMGVTGMVLFALDKLDTINVLVAVPSGWMIGIGLLRIWQTRTPG